MELIERYVSLYHKYYRLNFQTRIYIDENITGILQKRRTLGVHIRGTDLKKQLDAHPVCISAADFVKPVREIMKKYGYG